MAAPGKQYGLIFPKKAEHKTLVKHAVFMDDSDEESSVGESLQREALKKQAMKQTKLEIQRALAEDSTVYEYDAIYDDIQQKKAESQASVAADKGEKKPKYIQNILKAAELRKKEQEKRAEKKIQKEREMEGHAFDDKEAFVTSAYKKKLQERAEEEEREKREAQIEACLDVTKQRDLSGFYRHLLNQAVGEEATPECSLREARLKQEEPGEDPSDSRQTRENTDDQAMPCIPAKGAENPDADSDLGMDSSDDEGTAKAHTDGRAGDKKETKQGRLDSRGDFRTKPKRGRSQRDSRSSSEEKKHRSKTPPSHPERQEGGRKGKTGQPREKDRERRHRDHGKEERLRSAEDRPRRQQEQADDKQRRKDRKERDEYDRELKREREREHKYSQWEQQVKERHTSHSDHSRQGEKAKGAQEGREEEGQEEEKKGSPQALGKDDPPGWKSSLGNGEGNPPGSEERLESKHTASEEGPDQTQAPLERPSKFAKRSSQETVLSARDRYLARQMARLGTKSYIEKEED